MDIALGVLFSLTGCDKTGQDKKSTNQEEKATAAGDANAISSLAQLDEDETDFEDEQGGKRSAEYWEFAQAILKAAEMGDVRSQVKLGAMYESEDELWFSQDDSKAFTWFSVAALSGDKEGATLRDAVRKKLAPEAVKTLEKMAEKIYLEIIAPKDAAKAAGG